MDRLVFTSNATINEQAVARQVLVNDLSNVSTVGFKSSYDVALKTIKVEGAGFDSRFQAQAVARDQIRLTPGPVMGTGRPLDIAMAEQAVMTVQAPNGDVAFTRRGDLKINPQGQLENGSGHLVLGNGGPIAIPPGMMVSINPDGTIFAADPAQTGAVQQTLIGRLLLRDASTTQLERRDDGLFGPMGKLGADVTGGPKLPSLTAGALEGSNVNAMMAMVKLMDQSRSFEHQVRNIKESKNADEAGATMLKLN